MNVKLWSFAEEDTFSFSYEDEDKTPFLDSSISFDIKGRFIGHMNDSKCMVYFGHPYRRLVSGGFDNSIRIWSMKDYQEIKKINSTSVVWNVLKFDDSTFIASPGYVSLKAFSIETLEVVKEFVSCFDDQRHKIHQLVKLGEDQFLCGTNQSVIYIINYSSATTVKKIDLTAVYYYLKWYSVIIISNVSPSYIYFNSQRNVGYNERNSSFDVRFASKQVKPIVKFDLENEKTICKYTEHRNDINTMCLLMNRFQEEILIAAGDAATIFIYNTSRKSENSLVGKIKLTLYIYSSHCIDNRYLMVGESSSACHLFDLQFLHSMEETGNENPLEVRWLMKQYITHERCDWLHSFTNVEKCVEEKSVVCVVGTRENPIFEIEIKGLELKKDLMLEQATEDLNERLEYLKTEILVVAKNVEVKLFTVVIVGNEKRVFCWSLLN